jgi:hypothetical protein
MAAVVTVKDLGDAGFETQIRERLEQELKGYDTSSRVSISRPAGNLWEIKIEGTDVQGHGVTRLEAYQTVDKIVEEAVHMVKVAKQQK